MPSASAWSHSQTSTRVRRPGGKPARRRHRQAAARRASQLAKVQRPVRIGLAGTTGAEWQLSNRRYDNARQRTNPLGVWPGQPHRQPRAQPRCEVQARWNNVGNKHYEQTKDYGVSGSTLFINLVLRRPRRFAAPQLIALSHYPC